MHLSEPSASSSCGKGSGRWRRVSAELYNLGLLTVVDRAALAAYCQSYSTWKQATDAINQMAARDQLTRGLMIKTTNGNAIQNPLIGTANKAASDMVRYAAEFGMTPSARARISAQPPGGAGSKFHGLIGGQES
jgi:P27 family predicted phage terminase small subunit